MKTNEIREKYLEYFEQQGHRRCQSDVLVPTWDPSVLFTPAGMNQFKDHFLGRIPLEFTRATTCQKCLRTGDIENVGRTAYHHTFFEMLGNFSFGDYFKTEAIRWAWEFLTSPSWLNIPQEKLTVTVYQDDQEAADIWHEKIGLEISRIEFLGEDDNFWPASAPSQGPDGVCGPCSEIFYHLEDGSDVEVWNLVFTQFNREGAPPNNLSPLPSKNIDTGMGLERIAATLQGVDTNYHIDTLRPIVEAAAEVCGIQYIPDSDHGRRLRRITDHVRACAMAVHENAYPGPNKHQYVIRRLLRRGVLDGHQIGLKEPFLYKLVDAVVEQMKVPYPELIDSTARVAEVIKQEEENFFGTIDEGLHRIEQTFQNIAQSGASEVDGAEAAILYQTYGVPPELFESMAAEKNLGFNWKSFEAEMERHTEATGKKKGGLFQTGPIEAMKQEQHTCDFLGYDTESADATLKGIISQNQLCDTITEVGHEDEIILVLNQTPFYAESGGQVGDSGTIHTQDALFEVTDTQKDGTLILHHGHLKQGTLELEQTVTATVNPNRRLGIKRAHSATHVMHYALQKTLGKHAQQRGSKVDADWLRFDFTNMASVSDQELTTIEHEVQNQITEASTIKWETLPLQEAREQGAMMLFGEKYPDPVRMVSMGQFSKELCGGTHLNNTEQIIQFDIIAEENVSAGTRRITALTGKRAQEQSEQTMQNLNESAKALQTSVSNLPQVVKWLTETVRLAKKAISSGGSYEIKPQSSQPVDHSSIPYGEQKILLQQSARLLNVRPLDVAKRIQSLLGELEKLKGQLASQSTEELVTADDLLAQAEELSMGEGSIKIVTAQLENVPVNVLRQLIDQLRKKASPIAVLLGSVLGEDKLMLVAGVSKELCQQGLHAGNWVGRVAKLVGGGGGGKPDMAQAGGKEPAKLPEALQQAQKLLQE